MIDLIGTIGMDVFAQVLRQELEESGDAVEIYVDSPGGDVVESNAMSLAVSEYALKHPEKHYTCVLGSLVASAAANFVAKLPACFTIKAYSDTLVMYHSCTATIDGNPEQLRDFATMMSLVNENVIRSLMVRTTLPAEEIKTAFSGGRELWLDGQALKACGLVNELIDAVPAMHAYGENEVSGRILRLVAQYKQKRMEAKATMDNEEKIEAKAEETVETAPVAEDTVEVKAEAAEEVKEEIAEEIKEELDKPGETDWEAECGKLKAECEKLSAELESLKAIVAKYTPSAKGETKFVEQKKDWLGLVRDLNAKKLSEIEYDKAYIALKAEHKAEFDAYMKMHSVR